MGLPQFILKLNNVPKRMLSKSNVLKLSLFATGLSGIVAEYILSTLATYFLGNSTFQWTMILSFMLFSMGLGSRLSKYFSKYLLEKFIFIEFTLSVLVSFCAVLTYSMASYMSISESFLMGHVDHTGVLIYFLAMLIGLLIGMEIPLVIRLNDEYETLRFNISSAMEKDYYGSLLGGAFFAFIGLPYLGLTYTPFILGAINFMVAIFLYARLHDLVAPKFQFPVRLLLGAIFLLITSGAAFANTIIEYGEQKRYQDRVIYQKQSRYQKIVVTQWKNYHWLYLNGNQQLSSFDEWLYHEPLVIPAMELADYPKDVLILGGGDGCAAREVLKFPSVEKVKLVDLDPAVTELGKTHYIFTEMNQNSLNDPKVDVLNADAYTFMANSEEFWDVMIVDFPDPRNIEIGRLFSFEFFKMCYNRLRPGGAIVIQAGSPYYATKAFYCVEKTVEAAGFNAIPLHNQVMTMGEWGWVLGSKKLPEEAMKAKLRSTDPREKVPTKWITKEAMLQITSFGDNLINMDSAAVEVNTVHNPVLPTYYRKGNWDLF